MNKSAWIGKTFLNGFFVVFPVVCTVAILWWFGTSLEHVLGNVLQSLLPGVKYLPGLGIAVGVVIIFAVGLAMRVWFARQLVHAATSVMSRVPLVSSVFSVVRDLMQFVQSATDDDGMGKVVLVDMGAGLQAVGFLTNSTNEALSDASPGKVAVFLQMSYQMGGYTVFVDEERVTPVDMSIEQAMRWVLSAGVSSDRAK